MLGIGQGGKLIGENEPYSEEALKFTKTRLLQHDVQIEVESMVNFSLINSN
jgi:hypothetical protein